jgi:hypothetical protein
MGTPHAATADPDAAGQYEIRLKGQLDDKWADWFEGLTLTRADNGETLLRGLVVDQAALYGVLRQVRDLGLPLLSVMQVEPKQADVPDGTADRDTSFKNGDNDMISTKQTAVTQTQTKDRTLKPTAADHTRRAGLAAMGNEGITKLSMRLAAVAGLAAAVILFVNAAKRAGLIPISAATQLVAPLAQAFAIILVVGLAAVGMRQSSRYSSLALALNILGLAAVTGVEWVINLVFVGLDPAQIAALRSGPLGIAFVTASITFLLGSILYCSALLRDGKAPWIPIIAYAIATVPIGLRTFVPELVLDVALGLLGASVVWLALWMLTSHPAPDLHTEV